MYRPYVASPEGGDNKQLIHSFPTRSWYRDRRAYNRAATQAFLPILDIFVGLVGRRWARRVMLQAAGALR